MKKISWVLMMVLALGCVVGCDSGSDSSDGEYATWVFVSDTDKRIQIFRDGNTEWKGATSFQLNGRGAEHTVELEETGQIGYSYIVVDGGQVKTETVDNQIIFKND